MVRHEFHRTTYAYELVDALTCLTNRTIEDADGERRDLEVFLSRCAGVRAYGFQHRYYLSLLAFNYYA